MPRYIDVSSSVIKRLPRYYHLLGELIKKEIHKISSKELASLLKLTASQIRQDLNCFGGFGQQGYGYNVDILYENIGHILGLSNRYKTILIGTGNLGTAIAIQIEYEDSGFSLIGLFDSKKELTGNIIRGLRVRHISELDEFCKNHSPVAAILCVPKEAARALTPKLVSLGIIGFWNFSHYDITLENEGIVVENMHLTDKLMTLCYKISDIV